MLCFFLINGLGWSPSEAYKPINSILAVYALLNAPLCGIAVSETFGESALFPAKRPLQFSIGGVMLLTTLIACSFGLQRAFGWSGVATAMILWQAIVAVWFIRDFRSRSRGKMERPVLPEFPISGCQHETANPQSN